MSREVLQAVEARCAEQVIMTIMINVDCYNMIDNGDADNDAEQVIMSMMMTIL